MKVYKVYTYSCSYCVVADNMGEAERIFIAKYWPTSIEKIELLFERVQIQKYDEQAKEK